jgi:hypothetical protein
MGKSIRCFVAKNKPTLIPYGKTVRTGLPSILLIYLFKELSKSKTIRKFEFFVPFSFGLATGEPSRGNCRA